MSDDEINRLFFKALSDRGRHGGGPRMPDPLPEAMVAARKQLDLSIRALAKMVNCSDVFIGKIESGKKFPSANLLAKLQEVLRLDNKVVQRHVHTRPYQFKMRTSAQVGGGLLATTRVKTAGGSWHEVTSHEKAVQLILAAAVALRSNGYEADPCLPSGEDQSNGVLPWIEVDLEGGATAVIKIEVRENSTVMTTA